jgi:outer membrane protein TolC
MPRALHTAAPATAALAAPALLALALVAQWGLGGLPLYAQTRASDAAEPDTGAAVALPSPLGFEQVRRTVMARNPLLLGARARAAADAVVVPEASTLPDPMLHVGAMNVGLPDLNADMPMSMAPTLQLTQTVPLGGKLGLRGAAAAAEARAATTMVDEVAWQLHARAAAAFQRLAVLDRQLRVQGETVELLESFRTVAAARYASGDGRQADVLRADVEVGRARAEVRRLEALRTAAAARLNALMDRPAEAPLGEVTPGSVPGGLPPIETLATWAESTRPVLRAQVARVDGARSGSELARRNLWPDLNVGLQYGTRADDTGRDHMAGLMLGVSLPVFASRRQLPRRQRAEARVAAARAQLDEVRVGVRAALQEALAEVERARSLLALYDGEILPTARASVESTLAAYRAGAADFPALIDTQLALNRFEMERHALVGDERTALATLEAVVGRRLTDQETDR